MFLAKQFLYGVLEEVYINEIAELPNVGMLEWFMAVYGLQHEIGRFKYVISDGSRFVNQFNWFFS